MAQDYSSSDQQQQYETPRKHKENVESHSVNGDSRRRRRPLGDLSSSASTSSQLPVLLSTSPDAADGLPDQTSTDNDQGHVESRRTFNMGRTELAIEQVCGNT